MAMRALNRPAIQKTEDHGAFQIIHPRNVLKAKSAFHAETGKQISEEEMIEAAEAAIEAMSHQFFEWIDESVRVLTKAQEALWRSGINDKTQDEFYRAAHDIRGTGTTFGFPLASRVADSLVYLLDKIGIDQVPRIMIDKHVDAIRAIVREDARDDNQLGATLVHQLALVTNRFVAAHQEKMAQHEADIDV